MVASHAQPATPARPPAEAPALSVSAHLLFDRGARWTRTEARYDDHGRFHLSADADTGAAAGVHLNLSGDRADVEQAVADLVMALAVSPEREVPPEPYQRWNVLAGDLLADGYEPGYAHNPDAMTDHVRIDAEHATARPCPHCGAARRFEAWASPLGGYGYAIAICTNPTCEHAETF